MVSKILSAMVNAKGARLLFVEADVSGGLPDIEMTGNLGSLVKDGRERIRVAIKKSGYPFPQGRVTINIAPAAIRKEGTGFDLAVAGAVLTETGILPEDYLRGMVVVGELGLDGKVNGIRGILPIALEARENGCKGCVVPRENYEEALLVEDIMIIPVSSLNELVQYGQTGKIKVPERTEYHTEEAKAENAYDYGDIAGQEHAKKAMLTAASGMHNILLLGPPGAGKTMLASRIPTIMPDMSVEEGLKLTCLYSVAGKLNDRSVICNRPFRAPHHSITAAALAGGGRNVEPGEVSLASKGVLFFDELTKYNPQVVEMLREPMESGRIMINRVSGSYELPADFMFVAAMNPCECGFYPDRNKCKCSVVNINRHYGRISKPILDRIDLSLQLSRVSYEELTGDYELAQQVHPVTGEWNSCSMKSKVQAAWKIQFERLGDGRFNSRMTTEEIARYCALDRASRKIMKNAYEHFGLSARAYHKVLKTARTLADIELKEHIGQEHILEALSFRVKDRGEEL